MKTHTFAVYASAFIFCALALGVAFALPVPAANSGSGALVLSFAAAADNNSLDANSPLNQVKSSPQVVLAVKQVLDANDSINKLKDANLPTERVSDMLLLAQDSLDGAVELAVLNKAGIDLTIFNQKMKEFGDMVDLEFTAHDEIAALKDRLDKAAKEVSDISEATDLYNQAQAEFMDQHFENISLIVDKTDEKIIDLTSFQTRTGAIYDAAASSVTGFVSKYWAELALLFGVPLVLYLIFRRRIKRHNLMAKIDALELEKNTLNEEIKKAQKEYFVVGKMSEGAYTTRVNVYGEMIRDLTKEIALLREGEEKLKRRKTVSVVAGKKEEKKGGDCACR